jgi:hypothetical protein
MSRGNRRSTRKRRKTVLKYIAVLALGSSLLIVPAIAQADESTTQPSPYTNSTPGNGPSYGYGMHEGRSSFIERDNGAGDSWNVPSVEDQTYYSRGR